MTHDVTPVGPHIHNVASDPFIPKRPLRAVAGGRQDRIVIVGCPRQAIRGKCYSHAAFCVVDHFVTALVVLIVVVFEYGFVVVETFRYAEHVVVGGAMEVYQPELWALEVNAVFRYGITHVCRGLGINRVPELI